MYGWWMDDGWMGGRWMVDQSAPSVQVSPASVVVGTRLYLIATRDQWGGSGLYRLLSNNTFAARPVDYT